MQVGSVEIKVTLSGAQVAAALRVLGLGPGGRSATLVFCEDVVGVRAPATPLLDLGVILRARDTGGGAGDSTVKLRPCRWSQLDAGHGTGRLKVQAEWSGGSRTLAASLRTGWDDDRLAAVRTGTRPVADLFDKAQQEFLDRCARAPVNLAAVTSLRPVAATRWTTVPAAGGELPLRAERWRLDELDLLELSLLSVPARAAADQVRLAGFALSCGLVADDGPASKTRRVLDRLVGRRPDPTWGRHRADTGPTQGRHRADTGPA